MRFLNHLDQLCFALDRLTNSKGFELSSHNPSHSTWSFLPSALGGLPFCETELDFTVELAYMAFNIKMRKIMDLSAQLCPNRHEGS